MIMDSEERERRKYIHRQIVTEVYWKIKESSYYVLLRKSKEEYIICTCKIEYMSKPLLQWNSIKII